MLIFGHREYSHLVSSVLSEFDGRANFQIIDSIFGQLTSLEEQIAEYRPDVIVSAGSNAAYLKSVLSLPVVSLEITESDIVAAVSKAAKLCDKIVMISFDPPPKILDHLQDMLNVKIVHKGYTTIDEAREQLYLSMSEKFEVVVSASFICGIAEQNGIRSILFYSKESCRKMLETALLAGRDYRGRVIDRSLNQLIFGDYQSPVILADNEGKVLRINAVAREEFQLDNNTDLSAEPVFSSLDVLQKKQGQCTIGGHPWHYVHSELEIGDDVPGHLFHFHRGDGAVTDDKFRSPKIPVPKMVHNSSIMAGVEKQIDLYARTGSCVLITGETGVGKELVARELGRRSPYAGGAFIAVNCGSIPDELFEGEMFGYVEGAFTNSRRGGRKGLIEAAAHGVLFLDEVSELKLSQQAKMLRFLQERTIRPLGSNREISIDTKVIASTNKSLDECERRGEFRSDLLYRLKIFTVFVTPLRLRKEDIIPIAGHYMRINAERYGIAVPFEELQESLAGRLMDYAWPGNVRELENVIERIVVNWTQYDEVGHFATELPAIVPEFFEEPKTESGAMGLSIRERELEMIRQAMSQFNNDKSKVAEYLGVSQTTLWRRLKQISK